MKPGKSPCAAISYLKESLLNCQTNSRQIWFHICTKFWIRKKVLNTVRKSSHRFPCSFHFHPGLKVQIFNFFFFFLYCHTAFLFWQMIPWVIKDTNLLQGKMYFFTQGLVGVLHQFWNDDPKVQEKFGERPKCSNWLAEIVLPRKTHKQTSKKASLILSQN